MKFNEYASVVVSAGYDQSLRTWDCRSHSTEPIQVIFSLSLYKLFSMRVSMWVLLIMLLMNYIPNFQAFGWFVDY